MFAMEQAWRALSLIDSQVTQAETKLGALLAAAGVLGGLLFTLVRERAWGNVAFSAVAVLCAVSILATGLLAMIGLYPRFRPPRRAANRSPLNPVFFHDIATSFAADPIAYSAALRELAADPDTLVDHLARQVHANAVIAQRKYVWVNRALASLALALASITALAALAVAVAAP
jgi:hypothetical protein